jgi:hypothetical protein
VAVSRLLSLVAAVAAVVMSANVAAAAPPPRTIAESDLQHYVDLNQDQFGGIYLDADSHTVHVNVTSAVTIMASHYLQGFGSITATDQSRGAMSIHVQRVPYSTAQLNTVMKEITTRQPWADQSKSVLISWGVDPRTDKVLVGLTAVTPELRAAAAQAFGDTVALTQADRLKFAVKKTTLDRPLKTAEVTRSAAFSPQVTDNPRLLDSTPYYGGDRIFREVGSNSIIQCTTSFEWTGPAMVTAGHCGGANETWYQGYLDEGDNTAYYSGTMGIANRVAFGNGQVDGATLTDPLGPPGGIWAAKVWANPAVVYRVMGTTGTNSVGDNVCFDGSFTNQSCGAIIQQARVCTNVDDDGTTVTVCGVDIARSTGPRITQPGDSGGPVFGSIDAVNNFVKVAGIISAGSDDGLTGVFTDLGSFQQTFGGGVQIDQ